MNKNISHKKPVLEADEAKGSVGNELELAVVISELTRLRGSVDDVRLELSKLVTRVRRPDLVKYSVKEAVQRLGRSRSGLYALLKEGEITSVKERGRTYITEDEIQRWERSNRT